MELLHRTVHNAVRSSNEQVFQSGLLALPKQREKVLLLASSNKLLGIPRLSPAFSASQCLLQNIMNSAAPAFDEDGSIHTRKERRRIQ